MAASAAHGLARGVAVAGGAAAALRSGGSGRLLRGGRGVRSAAGRIRAAARGTSRVAVVAPVRERPDDPADRQQSRYQLVAVVVLEHVATFLFALGVGGCPDRL
ncbi:hypothetical protein ACWCO9_35395, partial [Streptomyces sp. NPDC001937]